MNMKKILFISLIICFVCSLQAVTAVDVDMNATDDIMLADQSVDAVGASNDLSSYSLSDESSIVRGENDGSFSELQEFIDNDDTGTISLDKNYTFNSDTDAGLTQGIVISKDIVINGNDFTIDALSSARIFNIASGSSVTLNGINFVNGGGTSIEYGGSIYSSAQGLTISDCTFTGSYASEDGGALYISGDNCKLSDSTFTGNSAGDDGVIYWEGSYGTIYNVTAVNNKGISTGDSHSNGGTFIITGSNISIDLLNVSQGSAGANGGAMFITGNYVNVTNSVFSDCSAVGGSGGALYVIGNHTNIINIAVDGSTGDDGAAIYIDGDYCTLSNSTINNNIAGDDGAIYWDGSYGTMYNVTAVNNKGISEGTSNSNGGTIIVTGSDMSIDLLDVSQGSAGANGGAMFITGNYVNVTNSVFSDCSAVGGSGGALYIIGNHTNLVNITVDGSTGNDGAAIYVDGDYCTITDSSISNCIADDDGAIYWEGDHGKIYNITCSNNYGISAGDSSSNGGTICLTGDDITISHSSFTGSHAEVAGGTIFVTGNNVNITDSSFADSYVSDSISNTGKEYVNGGGAIYVFGTSAYISNCTFEGVNAREGGAIYIQGKDAIVNGGSSTGTTALNGGSIYIKGNNATVSSFTLDDSSSTLAGGAIYIDGIYASVNNSTFSNTYAKSGNKYDTTNLGGAIYIKGNYANISGSEFTDSSAYRGGVIYLEGSYCNVSESSFSDSYSSWDGGAIYSTGAYSNIVDSKFTNNVAGYDGGAIFWHGSASSINNVVDGCIFINNIAYAPGGTITVDKVTRTTRGGGAIYWSEGGSNGVVRNSQFINNSVQTNNKADGGAILWDKCNNASIDNCKFDGNYITSSMTTAWIQGGAIYLRPNTNIIINNSEFSNCWSLREAGALYIDSNTATDIKVLNSKFINNAAKGQKAREGDNDKGGGAVMIKGTKNVWLINDTFTGNTANFGGALTVWKLNANSVNIINSTFDGNKATGGDEGSNKGGSIYALSTFNLVNVTIRNSEAENGGGAYFDGTDVVCKNITFIDNTATNNGGGLYWAKNNAVVKDMVFLNNTAVNNGGALYVTNTGVRVTDVNMTGNKAFSGSAIYSVNAITLTNVYLIENQANSSSLELITYDETTGDVVLLFKGNDKYLNAIYLQGTGTKLTCTNVTFWDADGVNNTGSSNQYSNAAYPTPEAGQNITVTLFDDSGKLLVNKTFVTDRNGKISFNLGDIAPDLDPSRYNEIYLEAETDDVYYTPIKITSRMPSQMNASANKTRYHSNSTVSVNVTTGATGNVSVYYQDKFIGNITLKDSKGSLNISTLVDGLYLPAGNHTLSFVYRGNAKFDAVNTTAILEITKITPTLLVNTTGIGYNLVVNVTVLDEEYGIADATGNVTIKVGDRTAIIYLGNGQGMTIIYGLPIGNYTVNLTYNGDNNYYNVSNSTKANVTEKTQTVLVLDVDSEKIYFINETVPIKVTILPDAEGNITLYINGVPHELILQHKDNSTFVEFNATELKDGINYVFATYEGTTLYAPSWAQDIFHVTKYNATIGIETANITVVDNEVINITLPEDATGILNVTVNGTSYYVEIINGTATLPLSGLNVGVYNVTVTFSGDWKYYNATNSTLFNVTKATPLIIVSVENITYGENATVIVTLPDGVTGNVTIKLNETIIFTQEPIDGQASFIIENLKAGNYTIVATFNGNENYAVNSNKTNFTVFKATPIMNVTVEDIYYGDVEHIMIKVNANGTVTVKVAGIQTTLNITTEGNETFVYDLAVGNYPVEVTFNGNENYTDLTVTESFNVYKANTTLDVQVQDITVWDTESINVTLASNATGNVTINVNGVDHIVPIVNGTAQLNLTDLTVGLKTVWVFYDGDRNYTANKTMVKFNVNQRTPEINITAQNITVGENGNITVKVPTNAIGFVLIEIIGDNTYFKNIIDGQAAIYPQNLKVGNYTVRATYYGLASDNYTLNTAEANFTVKAIEDYNITVIAQNITYGENATVTVILPADATGNVTIYIDGVNRGTVNLTNGIGVLTDIAGLQAGQHEVNITYNGNERYASKDKNGTIFYVLPTNDWTLNIDVDAHKYGEETIITVTLPENAKENVTLEIEGINYTVVLTNGAGELRLSNLSGGVHEVTAYYPGDENYTAKSNATSFTVDKATQTIIISADSIKVGENATINITISGNATGNVTIYVGNQTFERIIENHTVKLNVTDLASGTHNIVVVYGGDQNYTSTVNSTNITVEKIPTQVNITVGDKHFVGDDFEINVTNSTVAVVTINGVECPIVDGKVDIDTTILPAGNYTATITINEDDKYLGNTSTATFEIVKRQSEVNITISGNNPHIIGESFTITVTNNTAVNVTINGKSYLINATNGQVIINTAELPAGEYIVTASIAENDKYFANATSKTFNLVKKSSDLTIVATPESVVVGKNTTIAVTMAGNETGSVIIEVNGVNYTVAIKDHVAQLNVALPVGDYTAKAYYLENNQYNASSNISNAFHVINKTIAWVNITAGTSVEIDNNLTFTVTTNSNATLVVKVNGVEITPVASVYSFNGTVAGNYTITAEVAENDYYTAATNSTVFTVIKHNSTVAIDVGSVYEIESDFTIAITNNTAVAVTINGKEYSVVDGKVNVTSAELPAGHYIVTATIAENDKYYANSTTKEFDIIKHNATIASIVVPSVNVGVGKNATITVTMGNVTSGSIIIEVGGHNYTVAINENVAVLNVTLPVGDYTAKAYYLGDDKYNPVNATSDEFSVKDKEMPTIIIDAPEIIEVDNNITFTVTNSTPVNVTVNGVPVEIKDGKYTYNATVAGTATIIVRSAETDDYYEGFNSTTVTVIKHNSTVSIDEVTLHYVGDNFTINVTNNTAVVVTINGKEYPVEDGKVVVDTTKLPAGEYTVTATVYENDKYYGNSSTISFNITKRASSVNITVEPQYYVGDIFNITIENNTAVNVTINGKSYLIDTNGNIIIDTTKLPAGEYIVTASVAENDKYFANATSKTFNIIKKASDLTVVAAPESVVVGKNTTITVTMAGNETGSVIIEVNGVNYTVAIKDHVAQLNVTLPAGDYTAKAYYLGDDYYNATNGTSNAFHVADKTVAWVNITADTSVEIDNNLTFTVTTNSNATLVVKVNDVEITPVGGVYSFNGTVAGNYTITAEVAENDYYTAAENSTAFTVYKHASEIASVVVTPVTAVDGHNTTITVAMANAETGGVLIEVNGLNYTVPINEGVATLTVTLPVGDYTAKVYYPGDDKYNDTNAQSDAFHVINKTTSTVIIAADSIIEIDNNLTFTVTTNSNATLVVKVNGVEVVKGADDKYRFNGTVAGNYTITAEVAENDYYTAASNSTTFTVIKHNSTVTIDVGSVYEIESDFTITITNNTAVVVTINGKEYAVADGKVAIDTTELAAGHYIVTATIAENDKYYANSTAKEFDIIKHNATIDSVVVPIVDVVVGKNATITVTMGNVTSGSLIIEVGGHNYTVPIVDKVAQLNVTLPSGDYTAKAYYLGDDKYNPVNATSDEFSVVNKTTATVIIAADSIIEIDNNLTFTVTTNSNSTLVVKVNGVEITPVGGVYSFNGTVAGNYTITAEVAENDYYTQASNSTMFTVIKHNSTVKVDEVPGHYVGDNFEITLTNNTAAVVTINGKEYSVENGKVVVDTSKLPAGEYTVTATVYENDKYYGNSSTISFNITKRASSVNVTADPINVNETAVIDITGPSDFNGTAIVNVDGMNYSVTLTNGVGQLRINGLANGTYDINVTYLENDKYLQSVNDTVKLLVNKVADAEISASAENITVGDPAVIKVTVPEDATGNVTVTIGNITRTVPITGGENEIIVPGVPVGDYDVKVTYNGDDKYLPANTTTSLTVKPAETSPDDIKVIDQGNGTVVVVVPEDATGNVTVTINGNNYTALVVNGTATFDLTNETPGTYDITATYSGDENHTVAAANGTVTIPKHDAPMSIEVADGKVGETIEVTVNVPENATGNVTVEINGQTYSKEIADGKAVFEITGLLSGNKTVTATYDGDDSYLANATTANFTVNKNPAPISVEVDNSTNGQATITVTLLEDATGYVIVAVDGTDYGINLTAGDKSVTIPIKSSGDYTAEVTYLGDEKYLGNSTTKDFHASSNKTAPNIAAEVDNVPVGEDVVVKVTVPEGGDGNVTVTIGNITKTVPVTGGENEISIPGVPEGTHDVVIDYSGNDQFEPQKINKKVSVFSSINAENITRGWNSPYDYKAEFLDKEGNVLVNTEVQYVINGKTYTVKTDSQGIAFLNTSKLDVGKYNVTIINPVTGEQTTRTTTIVKRLLENKDITMDFRDGTYYTVLAIGDDGKPVGEGEFVDIYVNTVHYSCRTDKDGYARLQINLNPRTYTVTAEYKLTKVSNKLVVKQTLKLVKKTVTVKKGKKFVLKAKLKWSNGKAIKGKKIVFKFKGKKYSAKTNSKGIAKVTIKKSVAKKLKKGKKYKYSATYVTNIVKGTVKVKK